MHSGLSHFLKNFFLFIGNTKQGRAVWFTALFYSFWMVINLVLSRDYELNSLEGRLLGCSTMENYNVGARVSLFYESVALLICSFLVLNLPAYFIYKKWPEILVSAENKLVNYSSLAGIVFFICWVFEYRVFESTEMVYFTHKLMLAGLCLRLLVFKPTVFSEALYCILIILASSLFFLIADINNLLGYYYNPDFYVVTFIIAVLLFTTFGMYTSKPNSTGNPSGSRLWLYVLAPVSALPLVSVLKDEVFLIFKANGVPLSGQTGIWLICLTLLGLLIVYRFYRSKQKKIESDTQILALTYIPLFVFAFITYGLYNTFIDFYYELFEAGNQYLPIMELLQFGVIPTLEKFNSHLLSDYFFSIIYSLLNGKNLTVVELELYNFLLIPVSYTCYYYLFYFLSGNPFVSLFAILFFPFSNPLFPYSYCFGAVALISLHKTLTGPPTVKTYVLLFTSIALLILWRIDLGYSCVVAIPLILIYYHFADVRFKINWRHLAKAAFLVLGITALFLLVLSAYRHVNIFYKLRYALNYLSSAQTYGYNTIGWSNQLSYKMHYFIFPAIVVSLLLALIVGFKRLNKTNGQRMAYLSLLFLCVYYIVNFDRGLVRHSLIEWTDVFTSSYAYIIIPGSVFVFFRNKAETVKYILFFSLVFFLILHYKIPQDEKHKGLFEQVIEKIKTTENTDLSKIEGRVKNITGGHNTYRNFVQFVQTHLKGDETFIDFANKPMLYFYTKKITPSYFYQNPLCSHNDFLQDRFVADLADYNTPYLVFSTLNETGYDCIDKVPNILRHYRMAEHFYMNYSPYIIVDSLCVWKHNSIAGGIKADTLFHYKEATLAAAEKKEYRFGMDSAKKYLIWLRHDEGEEPELWRYTSKDSARIAFHKISDKTSVSYLSDKDSVFQFKLKNSTSVIKELVVMKSDAYPDLYSHRYLSFFSRHLPYLWGSYDKKLAGETVLFEENKNLVIENNKPARITIPKKIDRTSGNTLIITCKNESKKTYSIYVRYGKAGATDRTTIVAEVLPSDKVEQYAFRVSTAYKWYSEPADVLEFYTDSDAAITIKKIQITKGS